MQAGAKKWLTGAAALATLVTVVGCGNSTNNTATTSGKNSSASASSGPVTLAETGSSLLYPLFNGQWVPNYKSVDKNTTITAASTGSGTGISQAVAGTVQIGASDAYLSDAIAKTKPNMLSIPLAISAQQIMYNLPGMDKNKHLKLSGDVLAQIYQGKITKWNDSAIAAMNPGVQLPNHTIVPVHRSDSSGDTFLFTTFLSDTNTDWKTNPGYSTSVSWPAVSSEIGAKGNDGVVSNIANTPYSVGYVGISWLDKAQQQGLGYAALKNKNGQFVLPTNDTISAAAKAMTSNVPADERISLVDAPGQNSYPIINFEYAIINSQQSGDTATALKNFLNWAIDPSKGNSDQYLSAVHFLPLPSSIEPLSKAQIAKIGG